ncbi:hypothetical protein LDX50_27080 [Fulvivirga sp. 1062]|uniref:Uncharacterized protein n=2 Tax=Fulvivirga sedimenti TaxID=2879465 RepID=A0A9X1HXH8_9BACT|nr:hypothetical protein [Fulvivirga sedimenti]
MSITGMEVKAQSKLLITDVKIARGDGKYENYSDKVANMASDIPVTIMLYRENDVSYYACFLYTQRGKKLKLKVQDYVLYGESRVNTKKQVIRQRMGSKFETERMMGVTEEEVIYNKDLGNKLRIIYRFELLY